MHTQAELVALEDQDYRDAYVDEHVRTTVAYQLRYLRQKMKMTQKQFARLIGKPPSVVSRLENIGYGKVTVQTLIDLAGKLDVALIVKFASFAEFLSSYDDISPNALAVDSYVESKKKAAKVAPAAEAVIAVNTPKRTTSVAFDAIGVVHGESSYYPMTLLPVSGAVAMVGFAVTPFAVMTVAPVSGDTPHV